VSLSYEESRFQGRRDGRVVYPQAPLPEAYTVKLSTQLRQLYINNIPPNCDPSDLLRQIKHSVPTADNLALSNPVPSRGFTRSGWVSLLPRTDGLDQSFPEVRLLDGLIYDKHALSFYPRDATVKIKLVSGVFGSEERVKKDLRISLELITSLNVAHGIAFDLSTFETEPDPITRLDMQIMFLRTVHWVCYYSAYEAACPEELLRHCSDLVLRDTSTIDDDPEDLRIFDKKIQLLIDRGYRTLNLRPITIEARLEQNHVARLEEAKFKCKECAKLFKGPEFVVKHLTLKHEDLAAKESEFVATANRILELPHFLLLPASMTVRSFTRPARAGYSQPQYNLSHHPYRSRDRAPARPGPRLTTGNYSNSGARPAQHYVDLDRASMSSTGNDISYDL
jgi:hypothetical protein